MVDALVAKAEEGRGRLRKLLGNRQQVMIQQCPNGVTLVREIELTFWCKSGGGKSGN